MNKMRGRALILNATYEPLDTVGMQRAIGLMGQGKVDVISADPQRTISSAYESFDLPMVIRLKYYVNPPPRTSLAVNKKNVLSLYDNICAYCYGKADTVDHVHPRSKGGENVWSNVVAACKKCNNFKDDYTLKQMREMPEALGYGEGWKLGYDIIIPDPRRYRASGMSGLERKHWTEWL